MIKHDFPNEFIQSLRNTIDLRDDTIRKLTLELHAIRKSYYCLLAQVSKVSFYKSKILSDFNCFSIGN